MLLEIEDMRRNLAALEKEAEMEQRRLRFLLDDIGSEVDAVLPK